MRLYPKTTNENPTLGDVLRKMAQLSWEGAHDQEVRHKVTNLIRGLPSGNYGEYAKAILNEFSPPKTQYVMDPTGEELLQGLREIHQSRANDCDDDTIGINAYLMSIGFDCAMVPVSFTYGGSPSHVFSLWQTPKGAIVLDPVAGPETRKMLGEVRSFLVVPCTLGVDGPLTGGVLDGTFHGWSGWRRR